MCAVEPKLLESFFVMVGRDFERRRKTAGRRRKREVYADSTASDSVLLLLLVTSDFPGKPSAHSPCSQGWPGCTVQENGRELLENFVS